MIYEFGKRKSDKEVVADINQIKKDLCDFLGIEDDDDDDDEFCEYE